ncbi:ABC transporter permease [Cellulomonas bogoriensis]|uniref:ABC transporter permease n=1 Tax=Cellulomonas bogoriensis 69B4 = DSM 16987 TaxID=1386082 RepID=A0A0A0BYE9_9CELL|nr:ABC transporter permease [Cellulomonas bogoriensis]KGM13423.1 ABC transporter permease [Cellulomonas bogoriensis 69B4 = DSM 16987]
MRAIGLLTRRNLRLFFRDRAAVFFSLLSALILIALYALFLGNLQVENLNERLPGASADDILWFVNTWVFAGITMITTLTTGLAALSVFVEDNATGRFRDFLVSPVRRTGLVLGYFLSSFIVSVVMSLLIVVVGQLYVLTRGSPTMTVAQIAEVVAWVALSGAAYAAFSSFVVTFLRSAGAFAALSTVVGTVIGFLAGAYIPVGTLPSGVVNVLNALPFAHSAMLLRGPYMAEAMDAVTDGPGQAEAVAALSDFYGLTASVGAVEITEGIASGVLVAVLVLFAALGAWRLSRRIR